MGLDEMELGLNEMGRRVGGLVGAWTVDQLRYVLRFAIAIHLVVHLFTFSKFGPVEELVDRALHFCDCKWWHAIFS